MNASTILSLRGLSVQFETRQGIITAVDDVTLDIPRGKTVALVGESGCGKSVTALSILRLIPQPPGKISHGEILLYDALPPPADARREPRPSGRAVCAGAESPGLAKDLLRLSERQMRPIRGKRIAMIFQDPMTALNPVLTVGEQIVEAIELHRSRRWSGGGKAARALAVDLMRRVGMAEPSRRFHQYPHQMSGGMLQRVMIAMAVSCRPDLLIADEPTTALDVTLQTQILSLLKSLQDEMGMSILLITHDLAVVSEAADYVYVMYAGRIVEHGPVRQLLTEPMHPYTQGLLRCLPRLSDTPRRMEAIPGQVPDPSDLPSGCPFHPRCQLSVERACDASRVTMSVEEGLAPRAGNGSRAGTLLKSSGTRDVLRRCVEQFEDEPSGRPALRELRAGHFVACWEANPS